VTGDRAETPDQPPEPRWPAALAGATSAAVALFAAWPGSGVGLTAAAEALAAESSLASDGVATWTSPSPLTALLPLWSAGGGHALGALAWVALALLVLLTARRLGAGWPGATVAALLVAAHPIGGALVGDLAGRHLLFAGLGLVGVLAVGLGRRRDALTVCALAGFMALGVMGHGAAALAALVLPFGWRALGRPFWGLGMAAVGVVALAGVALALAAGGPPEASAAGLPMGLLLLSRTLRLALLGDPVVRVPWDVVEGQTWPGAEPVLALIALVALAIVAARVRSAPVRFGAGLAAVGVVWTSQLFWSLPSPLAPGFALPVVVGLALMVAAAIPARWRFAGPLVAVGIAAALLVTDRPVAHFEREATLSFHELEALPRAVAPRLRLAEEALESGRVRAALSYADGGDDPVFDVVRVHAHLARKRWEDAEGVVRAHQGPYEAQLRCALAVARRDVDGERRCREAIAADGGDLRSHIALAQVLSASGRAEEAEQTLRELAIAREDPQIWAALVAHFERFGWLQEAVIALEDWHTRWPGDHRARAGLVRVLDQKVRGDLLEGRAAEAEAAARRLLELAPEREAIRFFLADALEQQGDPAGAERERERAREAGATPPPAPDQPPGFGLPPGGPPLPGLP